MEKFKDRICGFIFVDKTSTGNPKLSIVLSNIKDVGEVRLFALQSKTKPNTYKIYRMPDENKELLLKPIIRNHSEILLQKAKFKDKNEDD